MRQITLAAAAAVAALLTSPSAHAWFHGYSGGGFSRGGDFGG